MHGLQTRQLEIKRELKQGNSESFSTLIPDAAGQKRSRQNGDIQELRFSKQNKRPSNVKQRGLNAPRHLSNKNALDDVETTLSPVPSEGYLDDNSDADPTSDQSIPVRDTTVFHPFDDLCLNKQREQNQSYNPQD